MTPTENPTSEEIVYTVTLPASHVAIISELLTSAPMPMRQSYPVYSGLMGQVNKQDGARKSDAAKSPPDA